MLVRKGAVVEIDYRLLDSEGKVLEESGGPISYLHGGYQGIFPAVEAALEGRMTGDAVSVTLEPDDAFGDYDEQLVRVEPRHLFPDHIEVGMQFEGTPEGGGEDHVYTVTDVAEDKVVVDGNHPLAGRSLRIECTVGVVREATAEEIAHGHVHGGGGHHH